MAWNIQLVTEVAEWLAALAVSEPKIAARVVAAIEAIRILFAFDRESTAILLVAGDKAGDWKRWYAEGIPIAEQRFAAWTNRRRID